SSVRSKRTGAILFIDLDNFKTINDTLGHARGDLLLQQAATRLTSCVREEDTVARIGGDEFVVMLENLSTDETEAATQTESISEKILAVLSQAYQVASHECHSTCSIGITLFNDRQQQTDELLKQADIAMYQAKKAGRNTLCFFDSRMQDTVTARAVLEGELRNALDNHQFQMYYQIQMNSFQQPVGAEALIRWNHPDRGLLLPGQFIPLLEETGLILPIGQWVLETACTQLKAWEQEEHARGLVLAVNVSAREFRRTDFVAQVQATVQRYAINPKLLKLELTESALLENVEDTVATMNALKEIGVRFTLDDFGTGYSSLQYLKQLPLDQIKIDQSFVRDLAVDSSDRAIVRTILAMAHSMNLEVIAEGVETEEQLQILLNMGCTHYQGYLFGKPVPIAQFEVLEKQG
ncbi:MAG: EAL domain-containing protein, partial [Betaproteobacteria bacterium]|nr:EAL domain-containing protein [Betaproteobacteria bacterium]